MDDIDESSNIEHIVKALDLTTNEGKIIRCGQHLMTILVVLRQARYFSYEDEETTKKLDDLLPLLQSAAKLLHPSGSVPTPVLSEARIETDPLFQWLNATARCGSGRPEDVPEDSNHSQTGDRTGQLRKTANLIDRLLVFLYTATVLDKEHVKTPMEAVSIHLQSAVDILFPIDPSLRESEEGANMRIDELFAYLNTRFARSSERTQ